MNTQINLRLPEKMIDLIKNYSEKNGFCSIQEFIKEAIREKIFEQPTKEELSLVKRLIKVSEDKNLYGTEKDLLDKLRRNQ